MEQYRTADVGIRSFGSGGDMVRITVCTHQSTPCHAHDFLELAYVLSGSAVHTLNGKEQLVHEGDYFIIDYGASHRYQSVTDQPFCLMNCLFLPSFIDPALLECKSFGKLINSYLIRFGHRMTNIDPADHIFHDTDKRISSLLKQMLCELSGRSAGYVELVRCALIEVIVRTMRAVWSMDEKSVQSDDIVEYMLSYAEAHYMQDALLTKISRLMHFSPSHLSQHFRQVTGMTFGSYVQKVRLEHSCMLICDTDKTILEIAHLVGYQNLKFFNRIFKKKLAVTPREFRKLARKV